MTEEIKREYIFSTCIKSNKGNDDLTVVKEHLHHSDGTIENNVKYIRNYERPFYITRPEFQDHEQKKEFEERSKLDEFYSTESNLGREVYKRLNGYTPRGFVKDKEVFDSPYVYGTFVSSTVILGEQYRQRWPDVHSDSSLAIMDYETDVVHGTGLIISGSITFGDRGLLVVRRTLLPSNVDDETHILEIRKRIDKYLPAYVDLDKIKIDIKIVDSPSQCVIKLMQAAHAWQPDFLGFWNVKFDMGKMLKALELSRIDPALVFSDPKVPNEYKHFHWKEDQQKKVTAEGKATIKHHADLWHVATCPASFYIIDLMCLYKHVRARDQQRSSYSLDSVLKDEIQTQKLKFTATDGLSSLEWHVAMQSKYPYEYMAYNIYDCISVEQLDAHTKDVKWTLRPGLGVSDLYKLKSNPKRVSDDMHFDLLKNDRVISAVGNSLDTELDKTTPSLRRWIITLPAELTTDMGCKLISEYPGLNTNITTHSMDVDVSSAYPTGEVVLNVSMGTRAIESCSWIGLTESEGRSIGINLTGLQSSALDIAQYTHGYPKLTDLLSTFKQTI